MPSSDATLDIRRLEYIDSSESTLDIRIEDGKIFSIKANDYQLQEVIDDISDDSVEVYNNAWVDIYFESQQGLTPEELIELLGTEVRFLED